MNAPVTRCSRCKRPLKPGRRIGRVCAAKERAEKKRQALENALRIVTAPFSDRQIEDAGKLIADGRQQPTSRPGLWQTTSSNKVTVYITTALTCTCPSRVPCQHQCAVVMRETYEAFREVA